MSRCDEMHEKGEALDVRQLLAELIAKNQAVMVELEALGRLVEAETAAAHGREADAAARLGVALGELAEAKAAVESEKQLRIEAEERAAALSRAVGLIQDALAGLPSAPHPDAPSHKGDETSAPISVGGVPDGAVEPVKTMPGGEAADADENRAPSVDADETTVSIVVTLTVAEAATLDRFAASSGVHDRSRAARDLIRDGLGRSGAEPENWPLLE